MELKLQRIMAAGKTKFQTVQFGEIRMSIQPDIQNSQTLQGIAHTTPSALCPGRRQMSDRKTGRGNRKGGLPVVDDFIPGPWEG